MPDRHSGSKTRKRASTPDRPSKRPTAELSRDELAASKEERTKRRRQAVHGDDDEEPPVGISSSIGLPFDH